MLSVETDKATSEYQDGMFSHDSCISLYGTLSHINNKLRLTEPVQFYTVNIKVEATKKLKKVTTEDERKRK